MINWITRSYRKKQLRRLYEKFERSATIGEMLEIASLGAFIANESGDKNRIVIGHHTRINGAIICKSNGMVTIGNYSVLQNHAQIQCVNRIDIGNYVGIADGVVITDNNNHLIEPEERVKHRIRVAPGGPGYPGLGDGWELSEPTSRPVFIGDVAWIGAYAIIMKGVTIGEGAVVARNSTVTKDVLPYTVVAGSPARVVKTLEKPNTPYYE